MRYFAFLSYSHKDVAHARWLHRALERYKIDANLVGRSTEQGLVPSSLSPVFRDRDDFSAGHHLERDTLEALKESRALLVMCSPAAAVSRYVNEEVRIFKSTCPDRLVIPVIVSGGPDQSFPQALRSKVNASGQITSIADELLGADLRPECDGKELGLSKIVAGLLGLPLDEIVHRAERDKRRRLKIWLGGLTTVSCVLAGMATWAELNRREAVAQRAITQRAFERASQSSNELVGELVERFQNQRGVPQGLIVNLLKKAEELVDGMSFGGADNPDVKRSLGVSLVELSAKLLTQGDTDEALDAATRAVSIFQRLAVQQPKSLDAKAELLAALDELGDAQLAKGSADAALGTYDSSLSIARLLVAANPTAEWRRLLAVGLEKHADVVGKADRAVAMRQYQESLEIRQELADGARDNRSIKRELAVSLDRIAEMLAAEGNKEQAKRYYEHILDISQQIVDAEPRNTSAQRDLAVAYEHLGDELKVEGDSPAALSNYQRELQLMQQLVQSDSTNRGWQFNIIMSYSKVGDGMFGLQQFDAALPIYEQGLSVARELTVDAPNSTGWSSASAFCQQISRTLSRQGRSEDAFIRTMDCADLFRLGALKYPTQKDRFGQSLSNRAWYALLARHFGEALASADDAIAVAPTHLEFRVNKIHALALSGNIQSAKEYYLGSLPLFRPDGSALDQLIQADFADFRRVGFSDEEISRISGILESSATTAP